MRDNLVRSIIQNIVEEQRMVINIEDDISLTTETKVEQQEEIQNSWPKSITYKEKLLFDGYNAALRLAIKELNIDKTYVKPTDLEKNIEVLGMNSTPEADRYTSTSEDDNPQDVIAKRTRVTGIVKYFSYIPSANQFVLGFDLTDIESFGYDNTNRYVALVTCTIKHDSLNDTEIIIDGVEKVDANYNDNLDYIESKVKTDNKGKDVIIIFKKQTEYDNDIYKG